MPQHVAEYLLGLLEDGAKLRELDAEEAARAAQYAADMRALMTLGGPLGLTPPHPGPEGEPDRTRRSVTRIPVI